MLAGGRPLPLKCWLQVTYALLKAAQHPAPAPGRRSQGHLTESAGTTHTSIC